MIKDIIKKQIRKTGMVRELEKDKENLKTQINYLRKRKTKCYRGQIKIRRRKRKTLHCSKF